MPDKKDKKKGSLKKIILIFFVLEILILALSGMLTKKLQIGFDDGRFVIRHITSPHILQDRITEEFQPDRHLIEKGETPEIYHSEHLYGFFKIVFGEDHALSAFKLLRMLLIVDLALLLIALLVRRNLLKRPSKPQILFEMIYSFFEDFVKDTLGRERVHFTPYVLTLFIFIWSCNMIGLLPIPGFMEPTRNLNVPLGLGIMAVSLVHIMSIKVKGFWKWMKAFGEPLPFLAPLNLVGELSKVISISFRLFGNILGGAIIMLVVSSLVNFVMLPVGLNLFFGIFVGTIQAFVFTMLALTYIGVEISE